MGYFCAFIEQFQAVQIFSLKERNAVLIWCGGDFVHFLSNRLLYFFSLYAHVCV